MAEHDDEREVARRYRELPREEPPAALDAKIRVEARRAVITHPAPLVVPTGRRRWYFPVAAAAVIVLAVAVTWQVEREQPDPVASDEFSYKRSEESAPAASPQAPAVPQEKSAPQRAPRDAAPKAPVARSKPAPNATIGIRGMTAPEPVAPPGDAGNSGYAEPEARTQQQPPPPQAANEERKERAADAAPPAADAAAPAADASSTLGSIAAGAPRAPPEARAAVSPQAKPAPASPQVRARVEARPLQGLGLDEAPAPWLERIAQLRQQGRHDEADKALAEFRKRYPEYKIPDAMLERVERK
jgi:hypothetical protein